MLASLLNADFLRNFDRIFLPVPPEISADYARNLSDQALSQMLQYHQSRIRLLEEPITLQAGCWQVGGAVQEIRRRSLRSVDVLRIELLRRDTRPAQLLDMEAPDDHQNHPGTGAKHLVFAARAIDHGKRASDFYEELKGMGSACKGRRNTSEEFFRQQFPWFSIWNAIDESALTLKRRAEYFGNLHPEAAGQPERFEFIGELLGVSKHTAYRYYKIYRKHARLSRVIKHRKAAHP